MRDIYLDNSATTAVFPQAAEAAVRMMTTCYGNPSSLHTLGFQAEQELVAARSRVAKLIGVPADTLLFTSGGTEANNLAILGGAAAKARRGKHVLTSEIEHSSVLAAVERLEKQGFEVERLSPTADGRISPQAVLAACRADTVLVSLMTVNNETGARLDWTSLAAEIRKKSPEALIHTDAVQAAAKIPLSPLKQGVDLLSFSGHKLHAPKGVGALYVRKGVRLIPPAALGGGQEKGLRSGTEALPAIVAFGEAATHLPSPDAFLAHTENLRAHLLRGLADLPAIVRLPENGVPYIVSASFVGVRSETLVHFLAERHVYVSSGSACAKGKQSHVLTAMKLPPREISSSLRFSFSMENTTQDIDELLVALRQALSTLTHER